MSDNTPATGSAESAFAQPLPIPEPARKKSAPRQAAPKTEKSVDSKDPMEKLITITLHDSKEIPPGGQFVGVNGKQFWIPPGRKVTVPRYVVEALTNAVKGEPEIDEKMAIIGTREVPRLPFTVHLD